MPDTGTAPSGNVILSTPPPLRPGKVVCVGLNHASTQQEIGHQIGGEPTFFLKGPNAVIQAGAPIVCPVGVDTVDVAGELAVIIGQRARHVTERDALNYVCGYACANDVAVREWLVNDHQWFRAKSSDGFCPLGPLVTAVGDPAELHITVTVNGRLRQSGSTSDLLWGVPRILATVTRYATLEAGDVLLIGSPAPPATAGPGDVVKVSISQIGSLENPVVASNAHDFGQHAGLDSSRRDSGDRR